MRSPSRRSSRIRFSYRDGNIGWLGSFEDELSQERTAAFLSTALGLTTENVLETGKPVCIEGSEETMTFGSIFSDGFESGDISAWSISSPDGNVSVSRGKPDNCIKTIAETSKTPVPERGGFFGAFDAFTGFDDGRLLFSGTYSGEEGAGTGIYVSDPDGGFNKIADSQDELNPEKPPTRKVVLVKGKPLSKDRATFTAEFADGCKTIYVSDFSEPDFEIKDVKIIDVNGERRIQIEYPSKIGEHFRIKFSKGFNDVFECFEFFDDPDNPNDDDEDGDPTTTRAFKEPCSRVTLPVVDDELYLRVERVP